jgi:plastocyanin
MRATRRLASVALGIALLSSTAAQAQMEPRAADGQELGTQSPSTQILFQTTWGSNAASRWITEHNGGLGIDLSKAPAAALVPVAAPMSPVLIIMNDKDRFSPATLSVPKGTTLTWRNDDTDPHTVTGDPAKSMPGVSVVIPPGATPWDSGTVEAGRSFAYTLDTAGHYIYVCTLHGGGGMVATVDVTG